jgi:anthranilate synthase component 2
VHYLEGVDAQVDVVFNNEVDFNKISEFDKIVLSPGPGLPAQAGQMMKVIELWHDKKPILGVCLGFQALVEFFGGEIYNQAEVKHGVAEDCYFNNKSKLFENTPESYKVGLYHSWAAKKTNFPSELKITATSEFDIIMAFEHKNLELCGVQFHPESILSENGHQIIKNFLSNF